MANTFFPSIWLADMIGALTAEPVKIKAIRWVAPSAVAGNQAILTNTAGDVVWESVATGGNYVEESRVPQDVDSLDVTQIDSGRLYIYIE